MDSRYRFLTLGTPWTQSMPSRDVNAVTRLAEASWRRDKVCCILYSTTSKETSMKRYVGVHVSLKYRELIFYSLLRAYCFPNNFNLNIVE